MGCDFNICKTWKISTPQKQYYFFKYASNLVLIGLNYVTLVTMVSRLSAVPASPPAFVYCVMALL